MPDDEFDRSPRLTITWNREPLTLMPTRVGVGLQNSRFPANCGYQHGPGDTIWHRADRNWRNRVILCDPCAHKLAEQHAAAIRTAAKFGAVEEFQQQPH